MTLHRSGEIVYPTFAELRDQILNTTAIAYARRGLVANILPGSEHYIRAEAYSRRLSIAMANGQIGTRRFSPLDAEGQDLLDLCAVLGIFPRPASKASGLATIDGTGSWTIPEGYVCSATTSTAKFLTTTPNIAVSADDDVAIEAVTAGSAGNLDAGALLTWDLGTVGAMRKQLVVAAGGITGGAPADDDERLRARLLRKLSDPSVGGNAAQIREWAEESSAAVLAAYVHAAARGPGSYDVVLVGSDGDGVLSATVCTEVLSYIEGQMPGHASINVTSIVNEGVDIVLEMSLPLPVSAGGAGGGWLDSVPWPDAEDVQVISYSGFGGFITLDAATAPETGKSIAIWDPDTETLHEYTIGVVTGGPTPTPYVVTVSGGYGWDPTGAYISAGADRLSEYFDTLAETLNALGPGEKTDSPDIMPRARRRPAPDVETPSALTSLTLNPLTVDHSEILDVTYSLRVATGTSTPLTSPSLPPTTADATRRLRPRYLAIRKA